MPVTKEEILEHIELRDIRYETPGGVIVTVEDICEKGEIIQGVYNIKIEKESNVMNKTHTKVFMVDADCNTLDQMYLKYRYAVEDMLTNIIRAEGTIDGTRYDLNGLYNQSVIKFDRDLRLSMINRITEDISLSEYHKILSIGITKLEWFTNVYDHVDSNYPLNKKYHRIEIKIQCHDDEKRVSDYGYVFVVEDTANPKIIRANIETMFVQFIEAYNKIKIMAKK